MSLALPESMFGGNCSTKSSSATREFRNDSLRAFRVPSRTGQDVHVNMRIADMPENHILAGKLAFERLPVEGNHLPVPIQRDSKVCVHLQHAAAPDQIVHRFGQRMAKLAKAFAIEVACGK